MDNLNISNEERVSKFKAYLQRRFPGRSTAVHYESDMKSFLSYYKGSLTEVKREDIDRYVDEQRREGRSGATVKRRAAALKTFFDFLGEEIGQPGRENPVSMKRHGGRQAKQLPRSLSDEEVGRLLAVVEDKRDRALVMLMLYGGLRVEEVVNLKREDLTVPAEESQAVQLRVLGKGRKERIVYLRREAYQVVETYLAEQRVWSTGQALFLNQRGERLTIAGIQWVMREYARVSQVAVTCHRLRHTCARWLAEGEMPLLSLSRFLGHSSLTSTQRYLEGANPQLRRHYDQAMQPVAEGSSTLLRPPSTPSLSAGAGRPVVEEVSNQPTVVRLEPTTCQPPAWVAEWPAWLRESCLAWLNHRWLQWKPSRRTHHLQVTLNQLRAFWRWQLARRPFEAWQELTTADVAAFLTAELARGLTVRTVSTVLDQVYAVLHFLADNQQLDKVPPRPQLTLPDSLPRHLQPAQLLALETYVRQQAGQTDQLPWLTVALYYLLAHAGLRISEALDLQCQELDLTQHRLFIRQGKGLKDRLVYLTPTAVQALSAYLETVPHAPTDLFLSLNHAPLSYHQAYSRLRLLGLAAAVPDLSPLRLRHTYATTLLNNGLTLDALRLLMGHAHLNTTLIYARLADSTVENQYQAAMENVSYW